MRGDENSSATQLIGFHILLQGYFIQHIQDVTKQRNASSNEVAQLGPGIQK